MSLRLAALCSSLALLPMVAPAAAAPLPAVKVGAIGSDSDCAIYETYWGSWLVVECRKNFPEFRDRLQSAIAESGSLALSTQTGGRDLPAPKYVVTGRITGLGVTQSHASAEDYCIGRATIAASLDLRMRDAVTGAVVYGGTITKNVEIGSHIVAGDSNCGTNAPSRASYATVQREAALAAARALAFRVSPLRVTGVQGRKIALNYGVPMLSLGMIVDVPDGFGTPVRYRVTGAMAGRAVADPVGDAAAIASGTVANVVESDDPAANGRRFEKVDLP